MSHRLLRSLVCVALTLPLACKGRDGDEDDEAARRRPAATTSAAGGNAAESTEVKLSPDAVLRYGVRTAPVVRRVLAPTVVAPAQVAFNADAVARIGAPVAGRVVAVKARLGDDVKRGDELLVIESTALGEAESDLLQKRVAADAAVANAEALRSAYERGRQLQEQTQGVSLNEVQKREVEYRTAAAARQTALAAAKAAADKLALLGLDAGRIDELARTGKVDPRLTVSAPVPGRVVERAATQGELVAPDKESLLTLADVTTLWVLADVPESSVGRIAKGAKAAVTVAAPPGESITGAVAQISPSLDPATRSAQVRIEVTPERETALRPGMSATVEIVTSAPSGAAAEPVLAVPESAVVSLDDRTAVFVPVDGEENTFARRPVAVGPPVLDFVPVLSGVKEGEPVVVSGTFILKAELAKGSVEQDEESENDKGERKTVER